MRINPHSVARLICVLAPLWAIPEPAAAAEPAAAPTGEAKTGDFEATLSAHAAASDPAALAQRFGLKAGETAGLYNPADVHLLVHVPADYDAASPPGLLVFVNDGHADAPSAALKSLLDEAHLIFVAPADNAGDGTARAALLLDIADEFQKRYAVNKARVYLMEAEDAHFTAFTVGDVYTGFVALNKLVLYEKYTVRQGTHTTQFFPHDEHVPAAETLAQAKRRPFVLLSDPKPAEPMEELARRGAAAAMGHEGYAHVQLIPAPPSASKYPDFAPEWFRKSIQFLDAGQVAPPGGEKPAPPAAAAAPAGTRPAAAPPPPAAVADPASQRRS